MTKMMPYSLNDILMDTIKLRLSVFIVVTCKSYSELKQIPTGHWLITYG